jgi:hypothetical protein
MARKQKQTGGGSKLERTETVTVRLDPKLRYLAGLAARKQRRTLSSYIEWAIEESLKRVCLYPDDSGPCIADESWLWDVDDADRFVNLAIEHPHILTHEEQILWKLIRENGYLWKGFYNNLGKWVWSVTRDGFIYERLRECWKAFKAVAEDGLPKDNLPEWIREKPDIAHKHPDDDIPF